MKLERWILVLIGATLFPPAALAATFYVDPAAGSAEGDGSASRPWRTLHEVIEANLYETRTWASLPYEEGAALVPRNAGAPIRPGDTILLRSGYHGSIFIQSSYNDGVITIAAEPGHTPTVRRLHFQAASGWVVRGLSVSYAHAPDDDYDTLVWIESHGWRGPSHHVTVEDCDIFTGDDSSAWTREDWDQRTCNAVSVDGDDVTIRGNRIRNINFGISVSGRRALVERNVIDGFAGDGMRGLGDYGVFQYNTVMRCFAVNENHDDGFQSWSRTDAGVGTGEVVGIVLRGNTIINYLDPDQPFRGTLQGIGCFDGFFVDWVVENNVILTDHWHGITLLGARNCRVVNNTVLDLNADRPGPPWISIGNHKDGRPSEDCVVRNNLTTDLNLDEGVRIVEDHNLIVTDPAAHFVDYAARDVHLLPSSPAIDSGSPDLAPDLDRDEVPRPQGAGFDLGAYEWHEGDPVGPDADADADADADIGGDADAAADAQPDGPPQDDAGTGGETTVDAAGDAPEAADGGGGCG
ncbi:MAG: hypothetical protein GYA57_16645, partial [Myxococcales bacterium]|nr:hypothetical protein [Myxococcales bacterium]